MTTTTTLIRRDVLVPREQDYQGQSAEAVNVPHCLLPILAVAVTDKARWEFYCYL